LTAVLIYSFDLTDNANIVGSLSHNKYVTVDTNKIMLVDQD